MRFRALYTRKRMTLALMRLSKEAGEDSNIRAVWWALAWAAVCDGRYRRERLPGAMHTLIGPHAFDTPKKQRRRV